MPFFLQRQRLCYRQTDRHRETAHLAMLFSCDDQFEFIGFAVVAWLTHTVSIQLNYRLVMEIESDLSAWQALCFKMHVHLVFVTKYRRNVFTKEVLDDQKSFLKRSALILNQSWLNSTVRMIMCIYW